MRIIYENLKIGCMCNGKKCYDVQDCVRVNYIYELDERAMEVGDKFEDDYRYEDIVIDM